MALPSALVGWKRGTWAWHRSIEALAGAAAAAGKCEWLNMLLFVVKEGAVAREGSTGRLRVAAGQDDAIATAKPYTISTGSLFWAGGRFGNQYQCSHDAAQPRTGGFGCMDKRRLLQTFFL